MQQRYSEGYLSYQWRSPCLSKRKEKSAEVIVVDGNEPLERTEVSQSSEGLNIKLFPNAAWSFTAMHGGWAVAQSPILVTTITLERLRKRGYESLLDHYFKVSPQLNEPLYTRPVRAVV